MGAVAVFNYATWIARYPEFTNTVTPATASLYAAEAGLYLDNSGYGIVQDAPTQLLLTNMLVAHIAALNSPTQGPGGTTEAASPLVGRIANATEGSVSVGATLGGLDQNQAAAFFTQTKYGLAFWQATAQFRTFQYIPRVGASPYLQVLQGLPIPLGFFRW